MEKPHVAQPLNNNFVGGSQAYDPSDPQAVIRSSKAPPVMRSQEIIDESHEKGGKIVDHIEDREEKEAQMAYAKERKEFVQRLEQEHYQHSQLKTSESSMASLLN